ncbi:RES family NAD+ phosphorylase [Actinomadura sp. DC4]|uniref:RES family NAD+ phosphorylase n=1 Tax=Actinomadura sp. DC4 TaxID=3055069 RepID=UPI0025AFC5DF|nr:RES family NAD+ phosphorylase [Actinomadura sp. DC4]MDN3353848.1 RES family NAD+ phosphorylase [Actinomadura sp. DC4]
MVAGMSGPVADGPVAYTLPRGTRLWRVHDTEYDAEEFRPRPGGGEPGTGRFGCTADERFPYLYAALDDTTALTETLVRDVLFRRDREARLILRRTLWNKRLSALRLTADLRLARLLSTADLASGRQDEWLIQTEPEHFTLTREWAAAMRRSAGWAQGMIWLSKRDLPNAAVILYGDRCVAKDLLRPIPGAAVDLDCDAGLDWLDAVLEPYRIRVSRTV